MELKRRSAETVYGRLPSLNARPPSSLEGLGQGVIIRTHLETVKQLLRGTLNPRVAPAWIPARSSSQGGGVVALLALPDDYEASEQDKLIAQDLIQTRDASPIDRDSTGC